MTELAEMVAGFIREYGYVALFIYFVLETAFVLHFAPSEIVIPVAASVLVDGPVTFVLFVLDATIGATVGAFLLYELFERFGELVVTRYGRYLHLTEHDIERSQRWFQRWGESSVLWGRLFPFVRALVSVPAGIAQMNRGKFILYSAVGAGLFNTAITAIAYTGTHASPSFSGIVGLFQRMISSPVAYFNAHPWLFLIKSVIALVLLVSISGVLHRLWHHRLRLTKRTR